MGVSDVVSHSLVFRYACADAGIDALARSQGNHGFLGYPRRRCQYFDRPGFSGEYLKVDRLSAIRIGNTDIETAKTDILILGSGGAGLFAALHAKQVNPDLDVSIVVKGLLGKSGCTRMVQGGYNVALNPGDSVERHFMDTIVGGKWLPRQDLAWKLCEKAVERIRELENELGCFFDRNADGTLHQEGVCRPEF